MHDLSQAVYAAIGRVIVAASDLEWRLAVCAKWLRDGKMIEGVTLKAAQATVRNTGAARRKFAGAAADDAILEPLAAQCGSLLDERNALVHSLAWRPLAPDGVDPQQVRLFHFREMTGKVPDADEIDDLAIRLRAITVDVYRQTQAAIESRVPPLCPVEEV